MLFSHPTPSRYRWRWRRTPKTKTLFLMLGIFWLFIHFNGHKHLLENHSHTITSTPLSLEPSFKSDQPHSLLPLEQATELCALHNFGAYPTRPGSRKVYDLFMINDELDWLEIRLNTLAAYVDYFVIVESNLTFTGLWKPLTLKDNLSRFDKFLDQIIYHQVEEIPMDARRAWDLEDHQRNAMYTQVIPHLEGKSKASLGDVLVVSDVDEIPRPTTLALLRNCDFPKRLTLRSKFYYYAFQWQHRGEEWKHPQATIYAGPGRTILPVDLRNGEGGNPITAWWHKAELWNAGWHCSTCFQNIGDVLTKMASFSHMSLNQEEYRDPAHIADRVRNGLDLWDREGEVFDRIDDNQDIPQPLKYGGDKFSYLLNRDGPNAGFLDYGEIHGTL